MEFMEVRPCSSGFVAFYAVSSKCRGAGKSWNGEIYNYQHYQIKKQTKT
jgi:uncharacterized protein YjlB